MVGQKKRNVKMTNPVKTCGCGSTEIRIQKTSECSKCYQARRRREADPEALRKKWREQAKKSYVPAEKPHTAAVPPTSETTYNGAHLRVRRFRGAAKGYSCLCGDTAQEWSYRGGSEYEQSGTRPRWDKGVKVEVQSVWSRYIMDYDALCVKCHKERDAA